jgi:Holliday junction resolvase RusA-like endonuclease
MKRSLTFELPFSPIALKRPRFSSHHVWDEQKQIKINSGIILANQFANQDKFVGPLRLGAHFFFKIPESFSKTKQKQLINAFRPIKPDLDNLIKFVLDVGNNILYNDDALFVEIIARKLYSEESKTVFIISEL